MKALKRSIPYIIVFITSMGIMIVELVASRLVSKYFGNSLYTWTGVIGIVLGGISLGNYLGGKLADRYEPRRIISLLLLVTSFFIFLILVLDRLLAVIMSEGNFSIVTSSMVTRSVVSIFILFFLPSTALGTISPVMAKYALEESSRVGNTVGSIYAIASIGSIIGTFLSGFVLIPLLGIITIIFLIGTVIVLLSFIMKGYRLVSLIWICIIAFFYFSYYSERFSNIIFKRQNKESKAIFSKDSQYSYIEVRELQRGAKNERILYMDGLIHNRYDPEDPDDLIYDYEKIFSAFTDHVVNGILKDEQFTTLTLGGGACIFPAYLERHYPSSINEIVEIDPEVIDVAYRYFDFPEDTDIETINTDARSYVNFIRNKKKYDFVFLDCFDAFSVPYHLTTKEFTQMISGILNTPGYFIINCVDIFTVGKFLNAYVNTIDKVFPYSYVYSASDIAMKKRDTFVVIGSNNEIQGEILQDMKSQTVFQKLSSDSLRDLRRRNGYAILTDNHAPVENLMAPVFIQSVE